MSDTPTVADIPDAELVRRAVASAVTWRDRRRPAWYAISTVFALGGTASRQLCQRFGFDPETGEPLVMPKTEI